VDISDVLEKKFYGMAAHKSQFFDWLPWTNGELDKVPDGEKERLAWLMEKRSVGSGNKAKYYEAFEICEYGKQPSAEEIKILFPMIDK